MRARHRDSAGHARRIPLMPVTRIRATAARHRGLLAVACCGIAITALLITLTGRHTDRACHMIAGTDLADCR